MVATSLFSYCLYPISGLMSEFSSKLAKDSFETNMRIWEDVDTAGFRGLYFSEHHLRPVSLSPSPNLLVSAVGQRTSMIKLGVLVNPTPLYDPWRLAEETAMLDYLTDGRIEVGLGTGIHSMDFENAGISLDHGRERFRDAVDFISNCWKQAPASGSGSFENIRSMDVYPKPYRPAGPPIWIPASTIDSAEWAKQRGHSLLCARPGLANEKSLIDSYRATADPPGQQTTRTAIRRRLVIGTDVERGRFGNADDIICGKAKDVRDELINHVEFTRCSDLLLWLDFPGVELNEFEGCYEAVKEIVVPGLLEI